MPINHHTTRRTTGSSLARAGFSITVLVLAALPACGGEDDEPANVEGTGASSATGGAGGTSTGGVAAGGATGGVAPTGGAAPSGGVGATGATGGTGPATGGSQASGGGGAATGGTTTGGAATGGTATGGTESGGAPTGGTATGGTESGGAPTGGTATGGTESGGAPTGGTATGGTESGGAPTGGTATGGADEGGSAGTGGEDDVVPSPGCGTTATLQSGTITLGSRNYILNVPADYDSNHPYRLILGFHGANGRSSDVAGDYFGLLPLSEGSTIFVAANANGGLWSATTDVAYVDDILAQVTAALCIDTSRIMMEGFSQGAAMAWTIACSRPNVFRAMVGHSGGGVTSPTTCEPIAYLGSLGLSDIGGNSQATQTDPFARWNGCTVETLPTAPTGSHVCTDYEGCPAADPVRWCSYDGGHTPSPTDAGQSRSWMPEEVWAFVNRF